MATFGKASFSFASYASFRPSYPQHLYDTVLKFHRGPRRTLVDLGTGHGLVARFLAPSFDKVIGTDPSPGMINQAKTATSVEKYPNVSFQQASAEDLSLLPDESVDMVVAGQASHWFDYARVFPEMKRIVRPGGTLAFWGYKDPVFVDYPKATKMLHNFLYGLDNTDEDLGVYWEQPGRSIVRQNLRPIQPPEVDWDVERIEYEPGTAGARTGTGTLFMEARMTLSTNMHYTRTASSFHGWQEVHPDRKSRAAGGAGDCVDDIFDRMVEAEDDWKNDSSWPERELGIEWGSGLLLARKK